jgi:hypothetical protein
MSSKSNLHPIFEEALRPYTGTMIKDLSAAVERKVSDPADEIIRRAKKDPVAFLQHVMGKLADRMAPAQNCSECEAWRTAICAISPVGECFSRSAICPSCEWAIRHYVRGWEAVQDLLICVMGGATEICVRCTCKQLRGMHGTQWSRRCGGFLSADEAYQVVLGNYDANQDLRAGIDMTPEN